MRKMGKAGYLFMGLLIFAFVALVIVFAFQTYALVDGLFPSDNLFMKGVTVFSFDGCCIIYAGLEMFYMFKWRGGAMLAGIMWLVTFGGSLLCTIAYMNLSSDHLLNLITNTSVLLWSYALVTLVFAGDIVAITFMLKNEWFAYLDVKYPKSIGHAPFVDDPLLIEQLARLKSIGQGAVVSPDPLAVNGARKKSP